MSTFAIGGALSIRACLYACINNSMHVYTHTKLKLIILLLVEVRIHAIILMTFNLYTIQ